MFHSINVTAIFVGL